MLQPNSLLNHTSLKHDYNYNYRRGQHEVLTVHRKAELGDKINFVHDAILKNQLGEKNKPRIFSKGVHTNNN